MQRAALHELVQHFALLPEKGGILFRKREYPLFIPQRKACIAGFGLEELHALRSVGAVYVASPRVFCKSLPVSTAPYSVGRE